jgi:hypothetical protein
MAEDVISTFSIIYDILKYSYYCDEAIGVLNVLCKTTHQLCYRHFSILIGDCLKKRIITIKDRDQAERLKDRRLAYFKVRFEMSGKFDFNHLKKFVNFFNKLDEKNDIGALTADFEKMKIDKGEKKKDEGEKEKFKVINLQAFEGKKLLNLHYIQQHRDTKYDLNKYIDLFKRIEPDLLYSVYEKISIGQINVVNESSLHSSFADIALPFNNLAISQLIRNTQTSSNNADELNRNSLQNNNSNNTIHYLIANLKRSQMQEFYEK